MANMPGRDRRAMPNLLASAIDINNIRRTASFSQVA